MLSGFLSALLFLILPIQAVRGQDPAPASVPSSQERLEEASLRDMLAQLAKDQTLDRDVRADLTRKYEDALRLLAASREDQARVENLQKAVAAAPGEMEQMRGEVAEQPLTPDPPLEETPELPLEQVEDLVTREKGVIADLKTQLTRINEEVVALEGADPAAT